jgi:hypothetical protein
MAISSIRGPVAVDSRRARSFINVSSSKDDGQEDSMTQSNPDQDADLRALLTSALEVQLAAFKAGIRFWEDWIAETSHFVRLASDNLRTIGKDKPPSRETLLELLDVGRGTIRSMMELPRSTASHFIEELDQLSQRARGTGDGPQSRTESGEKVNSRRRRGPRKRAARVKS